MLPKETYRLRSYMALAVFLPAGAPAHSCVGDIKGSGNRSADLSGGSGASRVAYLIRPALLNWSVMEPCLATRPREPAR